MQKVIAVLKKPINIFQRLDVTNQNVATDYIKKLLAIFFFSFSEMLIVAAHTMEKRTILIFYKKLQCFFLTVHSIANFTYCFLFTKLFHSDTRHNREEKMVTILCKL